MFLHDLLEGRIETNLRKYAQKLLRAAQKDTLYYRSVKDLSDDDLLQDIASKLSSIDPSASQKYVPWIMREYANNRMKMSDLPSVKLHLQEFAELMPRLKANKMSADLNKYTRYQLADLIDQSIEPEPHDDTHSLANINPDDVEVIYDGPWGLLIKPKTEEASCILGHGTKWCTAASKSENMFHAYYDDGDELYIWRGKGGVAQFCFNTQEFVDSRDKDLPPKRLDFFRKKNPITAKLFRMEEEKLLREEAPYNLAEYAHDVIRGRWPEAEDRIKTDAIAAQYYAIHVMKKRWPEAEPIIFKWKDGAKTYKKYFGMEN